MVTGNMLCPKQWHLSKIGINSPCPNHAGCVANLKFTDQIGDEGRYARHSAQRLKKTKNLRAGCADGDSRGLNEFEKAFGKKQEKLKDPRHLAQAQKGRISRSNKLSQKMFFAKTKKTAVTLPEPLLGRLKAAMHGRIYRCCPTLPEKCQSSPTKKNRGKKTSIGS